MREVKIMKGLPGSGKSEYVRLAYSDALVLSTDDLFDVDGTYAFDVAKLAEYHDQNLRRYLEALAEKRFDTVVVDNTNVHVFEIAPYYRLAEIFGWDVEIVWVVADPELCKRNCVHGVPERLIDKMSKSFEPIPYWWRQRTVIRS